MTLVDILDKNFIKVPLNARAKNEVIEELVSIYIEENGVSEREGDLILEAVKNREQLASTAMENGVAIPHAKISGIDKPYAVIGISKEDIDFGGEEPSRLFFLVIAPEDKPSEHIAILSSIAKLCSSSIYIKLLKNARSSEEVIDILCN